MRHPTHDPRQPAHLFAAFRFANEAQPAPLKWLWPNRIPLGKLTLLVGDPGVGKSLLAADLAARVSAALPWPNPTLDPSIPGSLDPSNSPGGVLIVSAEDRLDDILHPRLTAAGANLEAICVLEGVRLDLRTDEISPLSLSSHLEPLAQALRAVTVPRLLIIDPLPALLAPAADPFSIASPFRTAPAGLTTVLNSLAELAHQHALAVLAVTHLAKTAAARPLYRARGSIAFVAAARSALLLAPHHTDPDRRVLLSVKSVYGPTPSPLEFRILPGPRLDWLPADPANPADLSADLFDLAPDARSALAEARDWLASALNAGPCPARDLLAEARRCGINPTTLRRAKRLLSVRSAKVGSAWRWFPAAHSELPPAPDAPTTPSP